MNPGICYVYEYDNNQRKRNVGFLKITRHYQSCILQLHVRGLPVGNGTSLELCAFYLSGSDMIGAPVASLTCFSRSISVRLPIAESHFPEHRPLSGIDGFLIRLPGGIVSVYWAASERSFDADPGHMLPPEDTFSPSSRPPEESAPPAESSSPQENTRPEESSLRQKDSPPAECASLPDRDPASADPETVRPPEENDSSLQATAQDDRIPEQDSRTPAARKIQRSDISKLPRRFWFLANNSFLLHGYHNYNHLLLVEEDGHVWLGVPGIYDVREAHAADLFGFPQFTRSYAPMLGLSEDERNDEADFGHWCRYLDSDGSSK